MKVARSVPHGDPAACHLLAHSLGSALRWLDSLHALLADRADHVTEARPNIAGAEAHRFKVAVLEFRRQVERIPANQMSMMSG